MKMVLTFTLAIVALMVGVTLFKQFNFQNLKFENPALTFIYSIIFRGAV